MRRTKKLLDCVQKKMSKSFCQLLNLTCSFTSLFKLILLLHIAVIASCIVDSPHDLFWVTDNSFCSKKCKKRSAVIFSRVLEDGFDVTTNIIACERTNERTSTKTLTDDVRGEKKLIWDNYYEKGRIRLHQIYNKLLLINSAIIKI
jgi:hypothetical protein